MILEGARIILVDDGGKKHQVTAVRRMIEVGGLGVIDGQALCNSSLGDSMRIGGRDFLILRPSIKDALGMIERRAQIITPKDSFMIPLNLDLGPGGRVIEGGVGSGALTLVLLKVVGPTGRVFSYETRQDYAEAARRNISLSENESAWNLKIGDICTADLEREVDAVVLDIPNPWDAMKNLFRSLRMGGYACCYVPNANQLETAVQKMREVGLGEIVSFETLQREMIVHDGGVRPSFDMLGHTGYLSFGRRMTR